MAPNAPHRRHSSLESLEWMFTNCPDEPPAPAPLSRSISTRISSFRHEVFPAVKRQTSIRFNPREYLADCFVPRETTGSSDSLAAQGSTPGSTHPMLLDSKTANSAGVSTTGRPPRSKSLSTSFLGSFNLGSMKEIKDDAGDARKLRMRAAELNRKAARDKGRVVAEDDDEHYAFKPPAPSWKQALRKLRAEAKRHVHPAPPRDSRDAYCYDAESYTKNFDDGESRSVYRVVDQDDELGVRARVLHSRLLTKFHSQRFDAAESLAPAKLVKSISVPAAPVRSAASQSKSADAVSIWQRRTARPLRNLELTKSL